MSDLDLTIPLRTRGRPPLPISCEIVGELTEADLAKLSQARGVAPTSLKKIRDSHHSIARLIAQGLADSEVCLATGYSASRISILKADPAFAELISFYRQQVAELEYDAMAVSVAKVAMVRDLAADVMLEYLEGDNPDPEIASDFFKIAADRSGMGPSTKSTNLNVNVDLASRIEAGRRRAQLGATAHGSPAPGPGQPSAVQDGPAPELSETVE